MDGFFECNKQKSCKCHDACKTCKGPSDRDCLEPNPGYICENGRCKPKCGDFCIKCTLKKCLTCSLRTELNEDTGKCDPLPGFYIEKPSNIIKKCDEACYTCDGRGDINCTECADKYFK